MKRPHLCNHRYKESHNLPDDSPPTYQQSAVISRTIDDSSPHPHSFSVCSAAGLNRPALSEILIPAHEADRGREFSLRFSHDGRIRTSEDQFTVSYRSAASINQSSLDRWQLNQNKSRAEGHRTHPGPRRKLCNFGGVRDDLHNNEII
ncbi:Hypothetical predicted protein [Xyrichtys novacula]|uniref:Uncharacterized protein n=1 Tax=Xyrichtys novacula TaxID=13765 RepID=A0AAV1F3M6_XYRNO|nr:Hypothetical predicted protein [Xyrichtys novacula]